MALINWEPFNEIERTFDETWPRWSSLARPRISWDLAVDVSEDADKVVVEMSIPGIDPKNLNVQVEDDYVRVDGSREEKKEAQGKQYFSREISRGKFERTVRLPKRVDPKKTTAEFTNGMLTIVASKVKIKDTVGNVKIKIR